nr:anaerobic ribonucleoside-triphosphate reductase [Desulfovibrio cuneatus]
MLLDTQCTDKKVATEVKMVGAGQGFERTRRITGYLVGTLERFNNAKRAEERERVKHGAA